MQTDIIGHYVSSSGIRLTVCDTSGAAGQAGDIHRLPPVSAQILAKIMTGAALLAVDFKNHEGISLKWVTGSALGTIHVDAYDGKYVRGYIDEPEAGLGHRSCAETEAFLVSQSAQLFVTRYSLLKLPYTSAVNLLPGDISACLTEYLNTSEQTLSAVKLDLKTDEKGNISRCGGFLAQLLPEGNLETFASLFRDLNAWDVTENGARGTEALLEKGKFEKLGANPISFRCTCSEERIRDSLVSLPETEKEELLKEDGIETVCHYCGKTYRIPRETLRAWFNEERKPHS
jgi:molecular chaperone Hsp33